MGYLLILSYESDAERKRIDYAIERWKTKLRVNKPKGAVVILDGVEEELNRFIEDLFSRIELPNKNPESKVEIYRIERFTPEVEKKTKKLYYETDEIETVWKFLDYLMAKVNASYEYSTASAKVYTAYTKKGQARIEIRIEKREKVKIKVIIEGYGEVVDFLARKMNEEIKRFRWLRCLKKEK